MSAQRIHRTANSAARTRRALLITALLLLAACATPLHLSPDAYPSSPRGPVTDDYFGVQVADRYRWLEELDGDATQRWIAAQNAVSEPLLQKLPHRAWLQARLAQLYAYERFGVPEKAGANYFF